MKKEDNLYDESPLKEGSDIENTSTSNEGEIEAPVETEQAVNFVLGGSEAGPDMQEMESGLSVEDSLIYLVGPIDEFSLLDFMAKTRTVLKNRSEERSKDPISVIIDSFGGDVYSTLGIIDFIENLDVPVNTIARGRCMSAAAIILACGTGERMSSKRTSLMLHNSSGGSIGTANQIRISIEHHDKLDNELYSLLASKTKKDIPWWKDTLRNDYYVNSEEALELGLIDLIG
jgi:ATP-dependent Clp protease protease subunit